MSDKVYPTDDIIINYHLEDEPEHPWTPLKRAMIDNPSRPIFVPTLLGERYLEVPLHKAIDFIKGDTLICGIVEYSSHHGKDILLLRPYIEYETSIEYDDEQKAKDAQAALERENARVKKAYIREGMRIDAAAGRTAIGGIDI